MFQIMALVKSPTPDAMTGLKEIDLLDMRWCHVLFPILDGHEGLDTPVMPLNQ